MNILELSLAVKNGSYRLRDSPLQASPSPLTPVGSALPLDALLCSRPQALPARQGLSSGAGKLTQLAGAPPSVFTGDLWGESGHPPHSLIDLLWPLWQNSSKH